MRIEFGIGYVDGTVDGPIESEYEALHRTKKGEFPLGRIVMDNGAVGPWKDNDPEHGLHYASPRFKKGFVYVPPISGEKLLDLFDGVNV